MHLDIAGAASGSHLPLFLLFLAFSLTFLVTRTITRLIRAGRGPFRNNVRGGVHIHHAVPGIILTVVGAFASVAADGASPGPEISALAIGIGTSLVLDEFALILRLEDVYWSREGQLSVQVVCLTVAGLGMAVLGIDPLTEVDTGDSFRIGPIAFSIPLVLHLICLLACVAKGKYSTAAIGAFIPPVAWVGAIRLARPGSRWAQRRYSPAKTARARSRAQRFDSRYGAWGLDVEDLVAGRPTNTGTDTAGETAAH
ncbi:hypothetical protein [Gordonia sp. (in: high G+C Gram-positive bacteria)]|uniref:hypothetical protein n=1 Tax=Gordonia sp. (in: high G+C Gram-positive bacteria) TaxID=84139 RepID=UPI00257F1E5E|nr:hypothetical protein [Gordonia sp. (in: high G+C Gram-positive bacteria)]